jgi:flagellar hook-basal body complex protein FliE
MPLEMIGTTGAAGIGPATRAPGGTQAAGPADAFADALGSLLDGVEEKAAGANVAVNSMLDKSGEVHDAMIALQRAEMSLQFTVQIRNKLVQAYQDIMRMPI